MFIVMSATQLYDYQYIFKYSYTIELLVIRKGDSVLSNFLVQGIKSPIGYHHK